MNNCGIACKYTVCGSESTARLAEYTNYFKNPYFLKKSCHLLHSKNVLYNRSAKNKTNDPLQVRRNAQTKTPPGQPLPVPEEERRIME